jgi:hypothetical protein
LMMRTLALRFSDRKFLYSQISIFVFVVAVPNILHFFGIYVIGVLPMHWPVILAGLLWGWRLGAYLAIAAPLLGFLISGMPTVFVLLPMIFELMCYGALPPLVMKRFGVSSYFAVFISLIIGRIVLVLLSSMSENPSLLRLGMNDILSRELAC